MRIHWASPDLGSEEERELLDCLRSGRVSMGPRVRAFEAGIAQLLGVEHAVAVTSGTAALDVALKALGIGPDDEVIVPALVYVATANAVSYQGATPVPVDIDPESLNVDPGAVRVALTPRTRGIIPIDYGGRAADHDALERIASDSGAWLLQDAAHSLGGEYHGRKPGTIGVGATLSFHVAKLITSVEGGMFVTDQAELAELARSLRSQGEPPGKKNLFERIGQNYRMSDLHASIGLAQLRKLDSLLARRREVVRWYDELLGGLAGLTLPREPSGTVHPWFLFSVLFATRGARDRAEAALERAGVETRICWPLPVHRLPAYARRLAPVHCPHADSAAGRVLSLPVHPALKRADVELISRTITAALAGDRA